MEPRGEADDGASEAPTEDLSVRSGLGADGRPIGRPSVGRPSLGRKSAAAPNKYDALLRVSMAVAKWDLKDEDTDGDSVGGATPWARAPSAAAADDTAHGRGAVGALAKAGAASKGALDDVESGDGGEAAADAAAPGRVRAFLDHYGAFLSAALVCQVGMIAFNIGEQSRGSGARVGAPWAATLPLGSAPCHQTHLPFILATPVAGLTYAFTTLGNQTGETLPAAFLAVPYDPDSPYFSYAGGLILVILVIFFLGVLATRAEPALNVLGRCGRLGGADLGLRGQLGPAAEQQLGGVR